jgi:shikimate kinase
VGDHLFLVGMMGAGKSTVGRLVAARLGWEFVDTDAEIERATGATVAAVFAERGEAAFRAEERAALEAVTRRDAPTVVSVGGGGVLDERNCARMRAGRAVVWLRASPATLAERVDGGEQRPLLAGTGGDAGGTGAALARIEAERRPRYEALSTVTVDVDGRTPDEVADAVVDALGACA